MARGCTDFQEIAARASPLAARAAPEPRAPRLCPSRLALRARGSLYEFVLYNLYKKCTNCYKNHTVYVCVLHDLYKNCMNSFVRIRTKISEKKICIRVGISTRDQNCLQSSQRHAIHHPTVSISAHFIYTVQ